MTNVPTLPRPDAQKARAASEVRFNIVMPLQSFGQGITYHLTEQVITLEQQARKVGARVFAVTPRQEQVPGLLAKLEAAFPSEQVLYIPDRSDDISGPVSQVLAHGAPVVAHVHGTRTLLSLAELKRREPQRLKIVYTVHSFRNASWKRAFNCLYVGRLLRKYVDYTIFLSQKSMREFVGARTIMAGGRGGVMYEGLEDLVPLAQVTPPSGAIDPALRAVLEDRSTFKFVYLATFNPGKAHTWLLSALAPVLRLHSNAHLVLPGGGSAEIMAQVRQLAAQFGLEKRVHLPGRIDRSHIPWVLVHCNAGIVASRSETFGHTFVEPMAVGLPVVGTRVGAGESLLLDYHSGITFEFGDSEGIARAATYLVSHPTEAAEMGRNAQALVGPLITWSNVTAAHLRIYDTIVRNDTTR